MAALPTVGGSNNTWGSELNAFLGVSLDTDGSVLSAAITDGLGYTPVNKAGDNGIGTLSGVAGLLSFGTRFQTDGYLADTNTAIASPGNRGVAAVFSSRLGSGLVGDKTIGFYSVIADSASAKQATITNATNATPIVITAAGHGMANGHVVAISNVGGNTAANGEWVIANKAANTFELAGSVGNSGYTSGGIATTAGQLYGAQLTVSPSVTRQFGVGGGPTAFGDNVIGCAIYNAGTVKATDGITIGDGLAGSAWLHGIEIDSDCDFGINFPSGAVCASAGIKLGGTYTVYGIDLGSGVFTAEKAIRLANSSYVVALNAAGNSDKNILGLNSSDQVAFDTYTRFNAGMQLADNQHMPFGATNGSKLGTATGQTIGFWNATPVIQYATTGTLTGFTAATTTPVLDGSTFTGNTGSTAYTIGNIVRALKLCGVMAA